MHALEYSRIDGACVCVAGGGGGEGVKRVKNERGEGPNEVM